MDNTAQSGGGISFVSGNRGLIEHTVITGNRATRQHGGGIRVSQREVEIRSCVIEGNTVDSSLGVGDGGGISIGAGAVTLIDSPVTGNTATGISGGHGGGISFTGFLTIQNSPVTGNRSLGPVGLGGGIYCQGELTTDGSPVTGNSALTEGNEIYAVPNSNSNCETLGGDERRTEPRPTSTQEDPDDDSDADSACATCNKVYLHNGEENFERIDLVIPGRGDIHFVMRRRYRSRLDYDGPLGFGWDFDYNERLFEREDGDLVRSNGKGHVDRWKKGTGEKFVAPSGHFRSLRRETDGRYVLRSPSGFKRVYGPDGSLQAHMDRNGNTLRFEYDSRGNLAVVIDPYGREIGFEFRTFSDGVGPTDYDPRLHRARGGLRLRQERQPRHRAESGRHGHIDRQRLSRRQDRALRVLAGLPRA